MNTAGIQSVVIGLLALFLGAAHQNTPLNSPQNSLVPQPPAVRIASDNRVSLNWSGYESTGGSFTGVSATWTIPASPSNGNSIGADAAWVGVGGVTSPDLIQAGTQDTILGNGQVLHKAFFETLPNVSHSLNINVNSGDSVTVSLYQLSPDEWRILFKDNTTGKSTSANIAYNSSLSSAEWIVEAPSNTRHIVPLDNFGTVTFSNAWTIKNGHKINISQANAQPITMGQYGQVLASTSGIGSNGTGFSVSRANTRAVVDSSPQTVVIISQEFHRHVFRVSRRIDED